MGIFGGKSSGGTFGLERGTLKTGKMAIHLNNGIIAGRPSPGRNALLQELAADSLGSGVPVMIIQNGALLANNHLLDVFTRYSYNGSTRCLYNMMTRVYDNGGVDIFSGVSNEEKTDWIIELMKGMAEMERGVEEYMRFYLANVSDIITRLADPSLEFSPRTLKFFTTDWMKLKLNLLVKKGKISPKEGSTFSDSITNYVQTYRQFDRYAYYCSLLDKYGFAESLSQGKSLKDLMKGTSVTQFLLNFHAQPQASLGIVRMLVHSIIGDIVMNPLFKITVICEELDLAKIPELEDLLRTCSTRAGCNVFFTEQNISSFEARCDGPRKWDPAIYANCFFVFQQTHPQDRQFWAQASGMRKVQQETVTHGKFRDSGNYNRNSLFDAVRANKTVHTGTSYVEVDKCVVEEHRFSEIDINTSIVLGIDSSGRKVDEILRWA